MRPLKLFLLLREVTAYVTRCSAARKAPCLSEQVKIISTQTATRTRPELLVRILIDMGMGSQKGGGKRNVPIDSLDDNIIISKYFYGTEPSLRN
jgi:hypothetical protein